jgi:hypothetical protein
MSFSSDSSVEVPEIPSHSDNRSVEFPHKEPYGESEFINFFASLFNIKLESVDQQELKAFCSVLAKAPEVIKTEIAEDPRMEFFVFCCIARADVTIAELLDVYAPVQTAQFVKYIPILLWVFLSQKSKRFVEPLLVQHYEKLNTRLKEFIALHTYGSELGGIEHKPICNREKESVLILYLAYYLENLEAAGNYSFKCFLLLAENIVNGVENPSLNIRKLNEEIPTGKTVMQHPISDEGLLFVLSIISRLPDSFDDDKKDVLRSILLYSQKEMKVQAIYICQYLLRELKQAFR